jgi:PAS domain S-box-containing protein
LENRQVDPSDPAKNVLTESIRVLHIDDDDSVQMFLKIFVENDLNIKVTSVTTAEDAIELIQTGAYDCLVSDYDMPGMDGITLANKIREKNSSIPIILYTGRGSEEIAERAFATGIDDYIRKESAPAHYQLVAKRIRQAVERRRISEGYKDLFENASDGIIVHSFTGTILDLNEVVCKRLGYRKDELLGKQLSEYVSHTPVIFDKNVKKILQRRHTIFEAGIISRDGGLLPVEVSARVVKYLGVDAILSFSRDISDRKRLESQMKERLEALQSHALELSICDNVAEVAKTTYKILHNVMDYSFFGLGVVDGDMLRFISDTIDDGEWELEYPIEGGGICVKVVSEGFLVNVSDVRHDPDYFKPKSGYKYLSELAVPVKIDGRVIAVINVEDEIVGRFTLDDERLLEIFAEHISSSLHRIKLLEETRKNIARIETINRHALHLTSLKTVDQVAEYSLDIIKEVFGFNDGCIGVVEGDVIKFKYKGNLAFQIPDISINGVGIIARACRSGESQLVSDTRLDPDFVKALDPGEYLSELDSPVKVEGKVVAVINLEDKRLGFFTEGDREIIEVLAENIGLAFLRISHLESLRCSGIELAQSEARFKYLLDSAPYGVTVNILGKIVYVNKSFADMMGYTVEEILQKSVLELTGEEFMEVTSEWGRRRQAGENVPSRYEVELIRKDGSLIPVEYNVSRINFAGESASLTFIQDISPEKEKLELEKRINSINTHASILNNIQSEVDVAKETLKILHNHLRCELLSVMSVVGGNLHMLANWDDSIPWQRDRPLTAKGLITKAARERRTILMNDTRVDPDFVKGKCHSLSELVVPILVGRELLGVLNAESLKLDAFSQSDQVLMEAIAERVGSAFMRIAHANISNEIIIGPSEVV